MSDGIDELSLGALKPSAGGGPLQAVGLAVVTAGVTALVAAVTYGFAFDPPVTAGNAFATAATFDTAAEYRQFYRFAYVANMLDSALLLLPAFGVVTAVGVATSRRQASTGRVGPLAVAAGVAVGVAYVLLATVAVWTLPARTWSVGPEVRSDVVAVAANAVALTAVTTAGTVAGTIPTTGAMPWSNPTEDGA